MNRCDRPGTHRYTSSRCLPWPALRAGCAEAGDGRTRPAAARTDRQAEIVERSGSVMSFDLDRTTQRFSKTARGGVQVVVADDPQSKTEIGLIRQHLRHEADQLSRSDHADPTFPGHGHARPRGATRERRQDHRRQLATVRG
jgi:hypothetical protein